MPFSTDLAQFNADYLHLTREAAERCENHDLPDSMVIGTSAIVGTEIDGRSIGAVKSYTLRDVTEDHTIQVIFMKANGNPQTGVDANASERP